jgi:superfamily II DNA or RNA helicase
MKLRPYQLECVAALEKGLATYKHPLLVVLPTGSGKTIIFKTLVDRLKNKTVLIVVNRSALVSQTAKQLSEHLPAIYAAEYKSHAFGPITIGMAQSLMRASHIPQFDVVILDECHNFTPAWLPFIGTGKVIGFTATPFKNNKPIYGQKDELFPSISFTRSIDFMISNGFLVTPTMKAPPHSFDTSTLASEGEDFKLQDIFKLVDDNDKAAAQVKDAMPRLTGRKHIVWICANIEHAEKIAALIPEPSVLNHSKKDENTEDRNRFERGDVRHMVSVMMLSEGYDFPPTDAIVLVRPTKSIKLYIQAVGRGLRKSDGKDDLLILDYGEVVKNCGPLNAPFIGVHRSATEKPPLEIQMWLCDSCYTFNTTSLPSCKECDAPKPEKQINFEKSLKRQHEEAELLKQPKAYNIDSVEIRTHISRSTGNRCIRIDYYPNSITGIFSEYFTNHPFSWTKACSRINQLGAFVDTESFEKAYAMIAEHGPLPVEHTPEKVIVKSDGKFNKIERIHFRKRDPNNSQLF